MRLRERQQRTRDIFRETCPNLTQPPASVRNSVAPQQVTDKTSDPVKPDLRPDLNLTQTCPNLTHAPEVPADLQSWPPRPVELARWPLADREQWGHRANELEEQGLDWRNAERQAYLELRDQRATRL